MSSNEKPAKVVAIRTDGYDVDETEMEEAIAECVADGWTLFNVSITNQYSYQGTGSPVAYLTFIK